ncbi:hypothetical protein FACS1894126_6310 [Alphaproteobacteria bacterium]|nr:hypothetical protein FACS1894126_6310 [Alphaproteobacteria bacterium]
MKAGILEGEIFQESRAGTPQGGVISPLLANIALHSLEYETKQALGDELFNYLKSSLGQAGRKRSPMNLCIVRYADDFVIMHESREIIEKAKEFVQQWLKQMGLQLSETTRAFHKIF